MLRQFLEWLESGAKTPAELAAFSLARIREGDDALRAWVEVGLQPSVDSGPLCGIPFGVKDTFETPGLSTAYGSALFAGRKGSSEASMVTELRRRGAVLVGKTHTTPFASFDPAPTRNPWDPARTPGGSSSGSAAAVAAGMIPFTLGSQTQGSVLRPASYCGVTGFKPTFGLLPTSGILPFAPSLDTAGLFTQTAGDMQLLWERTWSGTPADRPLPACAVFREDVEPLMQDCFEATVERLRAAGARVDWIELPDGYDRLREASRLINSYEGSRTHRACWLEHGDRMGSKLARLIENGLGIPDDDYQAAREQVASMRLVMAQIFRAYPVILTPAAPGPPPLADSTGDPRLNATWTALGTPAISVPMPTSGLPLGLQCAAERGEDDLLVSAAVAIEAMLRPATSR